MPLTIPRIRLDPQGEPLTVEIRFPTLQIVTYTLTLYEPGSNSVVLSRRGNNVNPEDDRYSLPTPVALDVGRYLQLDATFVDPGRTSGAACRAEARVRQGSADLGCLVIAGTMDGSSFSGTDFAQLVAR